MAITGVLAWLGSFFRYSYLGRLLGLAIKIFMSLWGRQGNRKATFSTFISQTYFTGIEAIQHIAILALGVGALTILQAVTLMPKLGGGGALGDVMVGVVIRELGPLITGLFIAGRTGSAMSTYIGNMKVGQEIDALQAMGINPIHYQIMPAFFGTILSMVCLTVLFNSVAVLGGFFIVWIITLWVPEMLSAHISLGLFIEKIFQAMSLWDLILGVLKPVCFGIFIALMACYHGLNVGMDVREVPRATRMTVVRTYVTIIMFDFILGVPFLLQVRENIIL